MDGPLAQLRTAVSHQVFLIVADFILNETKIYNLQLNLIFLVMYFVTYLGKHNVSGTILLILTLT